MKTYARSTVLALLALFFLLGAGALILSLPWSASSRSDLEVEWAQCMNQAGWDVQPRQDIQIPSSKRPAFEKDAQACDTAVGQSVAAVSGVSASGDPADSTTEEQQANQQLTELVACMRERGWQLPDPVLSDNDTLALAEHDLLRKLTSVEEDRMRLDGETCEMQVNDFNSEGHPHAGEQHGESHDHESHDH